MIDNIALGWFLWATTISFFSSLGLWLLAWSGTILVKAFKVSLK